MQLIQTWMGVTYAVALFEQIRNLPHEQTCQVLMKNSDPILENFTIDTVHYKPR